MRARMGSLSLVTHVSINVFHQVHVLLGPGQDPYTTYMTLLDRVKRT